MADRYGGNDGYVGYSPQYQQPIDYKYEMAKGGFTGMNEGVGKGAAVGTKIMPGIGTAIGAIAGGIGGLFEGFMGGNDKAKREREKRRAWEAAQQQLARERYQSRVAATRNITNAYSPANEMLADMYGREAALNMRNTPWGRGGGGGGGGSSYSPAAQVEQADEINPRKRKIQPESAPAKGKNGVKPVAR